MFLYYFSLSLFHVQLLLLLLLLLSPSSLHYKLLTLGHRKSAFQCVIHVLAPLKKSSIKERWKLVLPVLAGRKVTVPSSSFSLLGLNIRGVIKHRYKRFFPSLYKL